MAIRLLGREKKTSTTGTRKIKKTSSIFTHRAIQEEELISHIPDDIDEILPKVKKPSDKVIQKIITPISTRLESISPRIKHAVRKFELDSALTENKYAETVKPFIDNLFIF
ncbi:hypothetical protein IJD44_11230 [bacterium]|nr:hypothetical protein [bacterium]